MHSPTPGSPLSKGQMLLMASASLPLLAAFAVLGTRPKHKDGQWMDGPTRTGRRQPRSSNRVFLGSICLFGIH